MITRTLKLVDFGSFEGTNSPNEIIPYKLSFPSKQIFISCRDANNQNVTIVRNYLNNLHSGIQYKIKPSNLNGFFVGNSSNYHESANAKGCVYDWVAMA